MVGFSFVAKGTRNREAISLPRSLDSKLPSILTASRFPLPVRHVKLQREKKSSTGRCGPQRMSKQLAIKPTSKPIHSRYETAL